VLVKLHAFVEAAKSSASDGLTWSEFGELLVAFLRLAVSLYDDVVGMTGEEKKAAVLDGVAALFDAVADRCIPLVLWPLWGLARGPVRLLVLALAAGAIEQLLPLVRLA
jgi:hypothetical protein